MLVLVLQGIGVEYGVDTWHPIVVVDVGVSVDVDVGVGVAGDRCRIRCLYPVSNRGFRCSCC